MTRRDVLNEIEASEAAGVFDNHIDPIPEEMIIPVTENYHYPNSRTLFEKLKFGFEKLFIVKPFIIYQNKCVMKTTVIGKENLKGLKAAVLTCNHIAKFDCLCAKYGARGHRTFVVAAPFNNMKGFLGEMMRAGDMLPMSKTMKGNYKFNRMVEDVLTKHKDFLLVYPEASMWWQYKKPRPYKVGAFGIAEKYNVPVVPMFITLKETAKLDYEGLPEYNYTLHIMPPMFPDKSLPRKEQIEKLRDYAFSSAKAAYESTYGIPLEYTCNKEMPLQKTNVQ